MTPADPEDRIRVLHLARSYPNPVMETLGLWTEYPVRSLARQCDVRVVSPVPWCPPMPPMGALRQYTRFRAIPSEETRDGVSVLHPRMVVGPGRSTYPLEARSYLRAVSPAVRRMRRHFRFDLIHAHFIYPDGVVAQRLANRYGVPFVVTEQAPWIPWLEQASIGRQALRAAGGAAALMPVSESVRREIIQFGCDPARVHVVPNGVDLHMFRLGRESDRRRDQILYVGLINHNKGIDVLIDAMRIVKARRSSARCVIVGGFHYRDTRLQAEQLRAAAAPLGDFVTFAGAQSPEAVAQSMRESAVVVLPSRAESFGAVLVEAIASGTPVVATRCGGPEDIVTPDVGRLVPPGDPGQLATAIVDVLSHRERYPAEALRSVARARFDWSAIAVRTHEIYREVLGRASDSVEGVVGDAARHP